MVNRLATLAVSVATALVAALSLSVVPASALNNAPVATGPAAQAVTRVFTSFGGGEGGTCTGTAVSPTQIITAHHCIADALEVEVNNFATTGRIAVASTVSDHGHGHDVAFLNLAEPWTGRTLPMSTAPVPEDTTAEFYGMGDTGELHTASGRVKGYATVVDNHLTNRGAGDVLWTNLTDGASAESGDSGGPILQNGQVVGVMRSVVSRDPRQVLGTPLWASSRFVAEHGYPGAALPQSPLTAPAPDQGTGHAPESGSSGQPWTLALGAVVAVLVTLGITHGALTLPTL